MTGRIEPGNADQRDMSVKTPAYVADMLVIAGVWPRREGPEGFGLQRDPSLLDAALAELGEFEQQVRGEQLKEKLKQTKEEKDTGLSNSNYSIIFEAIDTLNWLPSVIQELRDFTESAQEGLKLYFKSEDKAFAEKAARVLDSAYRDLLRKDRETFWENKYYPDTVEKSYQEYAATKAEKVATTKRTLAYFSYETNKIYIDWYKFFLSDLDKRALTLLHEMLHRHADIISEGSKEGTDPAYSCEEVKKLTRRKAFQNPESYIRMAQFINDGTKCDG